MNRYISCVVVLLLLLAAFFSGCGAPAEASYTQIDQETARQMMEKDDGHVVVDVRRQDEYDAGHIPGAILIPNESIESSPPEALPDYDQIILIYCRSGNRSKEAAQKLADMGYRNVYEFGGIQDWTGEIEMPEGIETPEEKEARSAEPAVLRFSSFSGGGYEYSVEVEDPAVVSCETRYEYEEHAEEIDGASFDYIVSITGLKPGTTTVTVLGQSPIMESETSSYTAAVDENLHVTLTPVRDISTFFVYRTGEIRYDSYQITMDSDGYFVSVNDEPEQPLSADTVHALMEVIEAYDVVSWDGFDESRTGVLDGEGFWLEFTLTDGTTVEARGDNAFPDRYFDAMGEMWEILSGINA